MRSQIKMAFNRLSYDTCAVETELRQNTSFFDALMDVSRFVHSEPCRHQLGLVGATSGVSAVVGEATPCADIGSLRGELVALENDLRGQTRPVTRCPRYDFVPKAGEVSSSEVWKPVTHPVIRTDKPVHAGSCQMLRFDPLPAAPGPAASCGAGPGARK